MRKFKWIVGLIVASILFSKFFGEILQEVSKKSSDKKHQSKVKNELKKELEENDSKKTDKYENTSNLSTEKVQNFDAVLPCESQVSYVTHEHIWQDFNNKKRKAKVSILPSVACEAEEFREKLPEPVSDGSVKDYYGKVYIQLAKNNRDKMKEVYKSFAKIKKKYNLGYREFAEMAVSYVQSVPYVLVHPESCQKARQWGGFFKEYH
ncbi:MAG: hypothetical protein SFU27_14525, partial [Thermonemataceae bacterium]|nr:hypothetical protein [Thermonemataceae bacterium]